MELAFAFGKTYWGQGYAFEACSRLVAYEQDFADRLRDERIRSRVEVDGTQINVRLQTPEDMARARDA